MKSNTIISFFAFVEVFFIVFASFGIGLGVKFNPWFLLMTPVGFIFAWMSFKLFDDWSEWHSLCYAVKDYIAKNPYFAEEIKRLED